MTDRTAVKASRNGASRPAPRTAPATRAQAATPRRRTQAERSETTRRKLIEATAKLLRLRGYGGLRTVEVSEVAGVSRGAQLHHFPTKNALIIETARHLNQRMLDLGHERAQAARLGGDPVDALIADACDFFFGDYFFISLEISNSDERNEELKQGITPYMMPSRLQVEREWRSVLEHAGMPSDLATDVLTLTLSMVRGFAVRKLLIDAPGRFEPQIALWREIIGEHIRTRMASASRTPGKARATGSNKEARPTSRARR